MTGPVTRRIGHIATVLCQVVSESSSYKNIRPRTQGPLTYPSSRTSTSPPKAIRKPSEYTRLPRLRPEYSPGSGSQDVITQRARHQYHRIQTPLPSIMATESPNLVDTELLESTVPTHATVEDTVSDSSTDDKTIPPATSPPSSTGIASNTTTSPEFLAAALEIVARRDKPFMFHDTPPCFARFLPQRLAEFLSEAFGILLPIAAVLSMVYVHIGCIQSGLTLLRLFRPHDPALAIRIPPGAATPLELAVAVLSLPFLLAASSQAKATHSQRERVQDVDAVVFGRPRWTWGGVRRALEDAAYDAVFMVFQALFTAVAGWMVLRALPFESAAVLDLGHTVGAVVAFEMASFPIRHLGMYWLFN